MRPSDPHRVSAPVGGIICPVQGPVAFSDTWGASRSGGRAHKGVDMLSPMGTPTVAPVSGTVSHRGNSLGGLSWHLNGDDGTLLLRHPPVVVRQPGRRPRRGRHGHRLRRRHRQRPRHPPPPLRDPPRRRRSRQPVPVRRGRLLATSDAERHRVRPLAYGARLVGTDQLPLALRALLAPDGDAAIEGLRRLSGGASRETWAFDLVDGGRDAGS